MYDSDIWSENLETNYETNIGISFDRKEELKYNLNLLSQKI
jgi:hypothetical protein